MGTPLSVALLLSTDYFEEFYGQELGLTFERYVQTYRNDWSWDYCAMLKAQGAEVHMYAASRERSESAYTDDGYHIRLLQLGAAYRPWKAAPALRRTPPGRYLGQAANAAAMLRPLRASLEADEVDTLLIQEYWTGRYDVLAERLEVPVVAVDQGYPSGREIKWFKRRTFPRSSSIIVQTEKEAVHVDRLRGNAVRLPNAVDTDFYSPGQPSSRGQRSVLTVTRLADRQKRVSDLIRAIARLDSRWKLVVVGTGPDGEELEALAADLGVEDRVDFKGFVMDREVVRDLYREASVFALPSAYEGLPVALLEAMSSGAAVVTSDIPAMKVIVEHGANGLQVPVEAPDQLAGALERAESERDVLGAAARATIEASYAKAVVGRELEALCRSASA